VKRTIFYLPLLAIVAACGSHDESKTPVVNTVPAKEAAKPVAENANNETVIRDSTEKLFQNPFDPDAVYLLSQKNGTARALTILIKRDSQEGTQYSRWLFNCVDHTAQNMGVAANLQDLEKSTNSIPAAAQTYQANTRLGAVAGAVCP
jgi:hypothetical protein